MKIQFTNADCAIIVSQVNDVEFGKVNNQLYLKIYTNSKVIELKEGVSSITNMIFKTNDVEYEYKLDYEFIYGPDLNLNSHEISFETMCKSICKLYMET